MEVESRQLGFQPKTLGNAETGRPVAKASESVGRDSVEPGAELPVSRSQLPARFTRPRHLVYCPSSCRNVRRRGLGNSLLPFPRFQMEGASREDTRPTAWSGGGGERQALQRTRRRGRCHPQSFFLRALASSRERRISPRAFPQKREAGLSPGLPVNGTATAYWRVRKNPAAPLGLIVYGLVAPLTSV